MFQNHYNQTRCRCFVHIYYGNVDLNMETVYDALEGVSKPPIVLLIGGHDRPRTGARNIRIQWQ
jgi:hypothetical protein